VPAWNLVRLAFLYLSRSGNRQDPRKLEALQYCLESRQPEALRALGSGAQLLGSSDGRWFRLDNAREGVG